MVGCGDGLVEPGGLNTLVYDGENRAVSNTQAGAVTNYTYDGNGLRVKKQVTGGTKWQFTSGVYPEGNRRERDAESGNDYAVFRYSCNRLGRFLSPDRLAGNTANPQSLNRYAYVRNDAVNLIDPLGLNVRVIVIFDCFFEIRNPSDDESIGFLGCIDRGVPGGGSDYPGGDSGGDYGPPSTPPPAPQPPPSKPTCPEVFFRSMGKVLDKFPLFPAGAGPEDAARAAATAAATRHIINRGLAVPLRSSIVRGLLGLGEGAATALTVVPIIVSEAVGLYDEAKAWWSGACTTIWSK